MKSNIELDRRKVLGTVGGLALAGSGFAAFTGSAAASSFNAEANGPVTVTNDRGDLSEVYADPSFTVSWENLDDAVGKVFFLVEGKVADGDWQPLYRATPWLSASQMGTTGTYDFSSFSKAHGEYLLIADETGKPDYSNIDFDSIGGVTLSSFLDGTSMSSADTYTGSTLNGEVLQNNFPNANAGYYGAASDTAPFDNPDDGSEARSVVELRYTLELQRPNQNQIDYIVDSNDDVDSVDDIDGVKASDVNSGHSEIVMNGEDGQYDFANPAAITYSDLQANADQHVGVLTGTAAFAVDVTNQESSSSGSASSNPGGS